METRANYIAVGLFTLLAIIAAFGFVYWTAGGIDRGETVSLRVRIPGSASGLGRGSSVLFNGVKVGDVRRVYIDVNNPEVAIAETRVDRLTPITSSTKADIGIAGLTGQANIELRGGSTDEPNLLQQAEEQGTVAEIVADPSAVTNLLQTAQTILTRADRVLVGLEGFVGEARGPLMETVQNVRTFSASLAENSDGIDRFLESVSSLSETISSVSDQLSSALTAAEELLNSFDRDKIATIVDNAEQVTAQFRQSTANLEQIMTNVENAAASINELSEGAGTAIDKVNEILDGVDGTTIRTALTNFEQMSTTINGAANDIAKVTEKVGQRAGDIDKFIADASEMADRLNKASVRVDGVLQKLDGLLGSDEAEGLIADARLTFKEFREVGETLNARMGTITEGFARFSSTGLRDLEALIRDGRQAILRIERAITDFERNPQRILTGGEGTVRQYDGRARR
jgi:phospholipid/cholesterol/gamma-HCH transport system substrate-binding protein